MGSYNTAAGANLPPASASSLGKTDSLSSKGFYLVEEFTGGSVPSFGGSGGGNGSGQSALGTYQIVNPPVTLAEAMQHPTTIYIGSVAVNQSGQAVSASGSPGSIILNRNSGMVTTQSTVFRSPTVLANATDNYNLYVGMFAVSANTPGSGVGLHYNYNVNGGNWRIFTAVNNGTELAYTNTSSPVTAGTWYTLTVTQSQNNFTVTINGASLGTVQSPLFNTATNYMNVANGTLMMDRVTVGGTPAQIYAFMDRCSIYQTGTALTR